MNEYKFKDLIDDLLHNREIEFCFNNFSYSISNLTINNKSYWQFDNNTEQKSTRICNFNENETLINFVKNLIIKDISLKDIFNNNLYTNLYVL